MKDNINYGALLATGENTAAIKFPTWYDGVECAAVCAAAGDDGKTETDPHHPPPAILKK